MVCERMERQHYFVFIAVRVFVYFHGQQICFMRPTLQAIIDTLTGIFKGKSLKLTVT